MKEMSCPELGELIQAFESMATVVEFANVTLEGGDIELAKKNYVRALFLFKKLGNERGVSACLVPYKNSQQQCSVQPMCIHSCARSQVNRALVCERQRILELSFLCSCSS